MQRWKPKKNRGNPKKNLRNPGIKQYSFETNETGSAFKMVENRNTTQKKPFGDPKKTLRQSKTTQKKPGRVAICAPGVGALLRGRGSPLRLLPGLAGGAALLASGGTFWPLLRGGSMWGKVRPASPTSAAMPAEADPGPGNPQKNLTT